MKTLFINSKVWTGKESFTDAVGFDSETGKILFTGNASEAEKVKKDYSEVIDLNKKLVIPAFTDGHCHFIEGALVNSQLNLRNAKTKKDFIDGIGKHKTNNKNSWIYGGYFSEAGFKENIPLSKVFLDEICNDQPVIISRFDLHSAFANSKALEVSGILSRQNEFTPEELVMGNNIPTGELKERASDFILDSIPQESLSERTEIVLKQISILHSLGITSISDITLKEDLEIYHELIHRNKLLLNVDSRLPFTEYKNIEKYRNEFSNLSDKIKFNSLKAFYDGSLSSKTAYMHSFYKDQNHNGIRTEYVNSGEFLKDAFEIDKAGYQMSVHAIGDKAVTELLDLNDELIKTNPKRDRRFRVEHAQHIQNKDLQRFKDLNVIASVQPSHLFSDAKTSSEILSDFSTEHNYKKLFDIGARVCFGTDFPVVGESPFETIHFAMTRKSEGFQDGFLNDLRISLTNCLEAYTSENAYATYDESGRGKIKPGMCADLAVLENDLFKIDPDEIKDAKVNMTYFQGKRVY
ncbi:MAG TPA: amidohydrolase [Ignavibacteria bacterium]|nr:amidohydrolase [Ignavibacteria bacterium]